MNKQRDIDKQPQLATLTLLLWLLVMLYPILLKVLSDYLVGPFGSSYLADLVYHLSSESSYSEGKFNSAIAVGVIASLLTFYFRHRKTPLVLGWSALALIYLLWTQGVNLGVPKEQNFINLKEYSNDLNFPIWQYQYWQDRPIKNEKEFVDNIRQDFQAKKSIYQAYIAMPEKRLTKALYLMNVVSALWGYGYPKEGVAGCAENYFENEGKKTEFPTYLTNYLDTPIGCCTDYAVVLEFLFQEFGYESRVRNINTWHVFNEVKIRNQWYTIDANTNIAVKGAYHEILARPYGQAVEAYIFSHANLKSADSENYRPQIEKFRQDFLKWINNRQFLDGSEIVDKKKYTLKRTTDLN